MHIFAVLEFFFNRNERKKKCILLHTTVKMLKWSEGLKIEHKSEAAWKMLKEYGIS